MCPILIRLPNILMVKSDIRICKNLGIHRCIINAKLGRDSNYSHSQTPNSDAQFTQLGLIEMPE